MSLRKAILVVSLAIVGMLVLVGGVTFGALAAFNTATSAAGHRQDSMALMNEVRHEVDLLGRLVSSYVNTANPRFMIYYYDILAIREGNKPQPEGLSATYWEQVIAGTRTYITPVAGAAESLVTRSAHLGFDDAEQRLVRQIFQVSELMKQTEQVAFAATQGMYDPVARDFVSETTPQREFANTLLHQAPYLKLRADLAQAVEELALQVDKRTASVQVQATQSLQKWIVSALVLLIGTLGVLLAGFRYLRQHVLDPLKAVHRTAAALAGKEFGRRVGDVHGVKEVQAIATTIDSMATAIEADLKQRASAERELHEARARAEVATQAKSIFLANMSHEIRTPMNAILGMAYLALKSGLAPQQHDYVSKIHTAARSLLVILNDILDFSKIEAGKVVLESTPFDLEGVVENALLMVQERAEGKRVELLLDYRLAGNLPELIGDPLRLGQVLINLLSNAVKFTARGHVRFSVSESGRDASSVQLNFRIEDTGIGMSAEQVAGLFREFAQAEGATARKYGGTGLGLSISKHLVTAMGGEIEVVSAVDRGSVFSFSLHLPLAPVGALVEVEGPIACRRALVVDDYQPARESMAELLHLLGCPQVDQSASGEEALVLLQQAADSGLPYDLLLLDWIMPEMSGALFLDALSLRGIALPARTVVVSAADAARMRNEVTQPGISELIQKPLLPNKLRRICGNGAGRPAMPAFALDRSGILSGMRVLLVEDNEINQQVAAEILRDWGATVDIAANGQLGIDQLFAQHPAFYAVVLMDLEMPVLNGYEATRRLRRDSRFNEVPVIAMTAHAKGNDLQQALYKGMQGYIAKPFEPEVLLALLQPYLRQHVPPPQATDSMPGLADEQTFFAMLAEMQEIDLPALRRRFSGRTLFLARALRQFAEAAGEFVGKFEAALADDDLDSARRQVHTFKGLAGTFALANLQNALIALEQRLANGVVELPGEIAELSLLILPLVGKLKRLPANLDALAQAPAHARADDILALLQRCLSEGDIEVENIWRSSKARLVGRYAPQQLEALEQAITLWDFGAALRVLSGLSPRAGDFAANAEEK